MSPISLKCLSNIYKIWLEIRRINFLALYTFLIQILKLCLYRSSSESMFCSSLILRFILISSHFEHSSSTTSFKLAPWINVESVVFVTIDKWWKIDLTFPFMTRRFSLVCIQITDWDYESIFHTDTYYFLLYYFPQLPLTNLIDRW